MCHFRNLFFTGIMLLWSSNLLASWQFPVTNFQQKEYNAGTQNWQIAQQANGWLYFANNYGLLEFDGNYWRTHGIWNSTVIRSLAIAPDGTIYVGGSNEYGRFKNNNKGELEYQPLSQHVSDKYKNFGEVWNIHLIDSILYIQTRNYLFKEYPSGQVVTVGPLSRIYTSAKIGNSIYLATDKGIYLLAGTQLNALRGSSLLYNYEIRAMLPYLNNQIIIATDLGGLFIFDGESIKPFKTDADEFIKKNQLYSVAINDHNIALGTVLNGLAITDINGKNSQYINHENGLQNNTILSLIFDDAQNLWLGLDNGIDHIRLNTPIANLYGHNNFYGSGYTSLIDNNKIYLGTNQGLFMGKYPLNQSDRLTNLTMIEGSQGQVWSIDKIENSIFICHNRGLFLLQGSHLEPIITQEGVWRVEAFPKDSNMVLVGTYNGFYILEKQHNKWVLKTKLGGFNQTARIFSIDRNDRIWVVTSKGIERLTLDRQQDKVTSTLMIKHSGDPQELFAINQLGEKIYIATPQEIYVVTNDSQIMPDGTFKMLFGSKGPFAAIEMDKQKNIWYIEGNSLKLRRYDPLRRRYAEKVDVLWTIPYFFIGGFEHITPLDNTHAIVGNVNGYALATYKENMPKAPQRNVYVRKMILSKNDSLVGGQSYSNMQNNINIKYDYNSIRFEFASAYNDVENDSYSYKLEPVDNDWSPWSTSTQKEYTSLPEGNYTLYVRYKNNEQQISETTLQFSVLPPWYRTWWAYLIELIVVGLIVYLTIQNILSRIARKQLLLEEKKDAELMQQKEIYKEEAYGREQEIIKLKNERLELELKGKSQELANILLNQVNKNEILTEIKDELKKVTQELNESDNESAKRKITFLQSKISRNIEQNIDWKKFEDNFDIVNNQFIQKLTTQYPWLSKNERKLCIYIKMGLLTKEMAPLLKMSVRGVEMLRYRMRKKMELDRTDDLQHFFQLLSEESSTSTPESEPTETTENTLNRGV